MKLSKLPAKFKGKGLWIQDEEGELALFDYKINNGLAHHLDVDTKHKDKEVNIDED